MKEKVDRSHPDDWCEECCKPLFDNLINQEVYTCDKCYASLCKDCFLYHKCKE